MPDYRNEYIQIGRAWNLIQEARGRVPVEAFKAINLALAQLDLVLLELHPGKEIMPVLPVDSQCITCGVRHAID